MLLMTDAPGHGSELNDYVADGMDSQRSSCKPRLEHVINTIVHVKNIDLFFCRINEAATKKMESAFRKLIEIPPVDENGVPVPHSPPLHKLEAETMVVPTDIQVFPAVHFIFCLDESGSMDGQPWQQLVNAYCHFLKMRMDSQLSADFISVIQFASRASVTVDNVATPSAPRGLGFRGGGTCFHPAMLEAKKQVGKTPDHVTPVIIFMSDGGTSDADAAARCFTNEIKPMRNGSKQPVQLHGVFFGSGGEQTLEKMCSDCGSSMKKAVNGIELQQAFSSIGAQCKAEGKVVEAVFGKMSEMVATKLCMEFL